MRIGSLDSDERVVVVAEVGNNHEGDVELACELVERCAEAGADAIKLQVFAAERFVRPADTDRLAQLARFELSHTEVERVAALARERGLAFVATPLDLESVTFLEPLVDAFKIASGDNDFVQLLDSVAATGKPAIVSTGLTDLAGARDARDRLARGGADIAVLHCVSAYPASEESANLAAIGLLLNELGGTVGYSDHVLGIDASVAAAAAGARLIEKHVTLDHEQSDFRDHQLSAEPAELAELVERVRAVERLLGRPAEEVQSEEEPLTTAARRSIVAARDLPAGHPLDAADLAWMRPRDGLKPGEEDQLVGRRLKRAVGAGETLLPEALE